RSGATKRGPRPPVSSLVPVPARAHTEQNPVTGSDWSLPAATEPSEQGAFPPAADAATGSSGSTRPTPPAASRAASLPLSRGNLFIANPPGPETLNHRP